MQTQAALIPGNPAATVTPILPDLDPKYCTGSRKENARLAASLRARAEKERAPAADNDDDESSAEKGEDLEILAAEVLARDTDTDHPPPSAQTRPIEKIVCGAGGITGKAKRKYVKRTPKAKTVETGNVPTSSGKRTRTRKTKAAEPTPIITTTPTNTTTTVAVPKVSSIPAMIVPQGSATSKPMKPRRSSPRLTPSRKTSSSLPPISSTPSKEDDAFMMLLNIAIRSLMESRGGKPSQTKKNGHASRSHGRKK